ncbi:phosphatase domain-containing protein [Nonomuraea candida]|uniref:phosphatase domain-containing protein n=1 Tax=Nonomuraea candida TaxID=359159 RepID=UPI0006942ECE|nr:hypothetical protein [Nonomuraea candida]
MNRSPLVQAVGDKLNEHWPHLLNDGVQYRVAADALDAAAEAGVVPTAERAHLQERLDDAHAQREQAEAERDRLRERLDDALVKREAYSMAMHELFGGIAAARHALAMMRKGKTPDWDRLERQLVGKESYADERLGTRLAREASELRQRAEEAEQEAAELHAKLGATERETARAHQLAEVVHTSYGLLNATNLDLRARITEAIDLIAEYDGPEAPFEHHPKWAHVRHTLITSKAVIPGQPPIEEANLPLAALVDVDGTLALRGDRGPYDWSRVGEDTPHWPVIETVRALHHRGYRIVVMSGRPDECRDATAAWLNAHLCVPWEELLMRAAGDYRKDAKVKTELYERRVRGRYDVRVVLDDRQQVVDAWRALGLAVFQVAPGDF